MTLTHDITQGQCFAEEVAVGPPVVVLEIINKIIQKKLFLLLLLHFGANANVQVHHKRVDLASLPVLPQPPWNIK